MPLASRGARRVPGQTFGQTSPQTHVDRLSQTQTSEIREISTCSIARNDRNSSHSDPPPVQSRDSTLSTTRRRSRGFQLDSYSTPRHMHQELNRNSTGSRQARPRQPLDSPSTAPRQRLDSASTEPRQLSSCPLPTVTTARQPGLQDPTRSRGPDFFATSSEKRFC
jgi:hypothetical protein